MPVILHPMIRYRTIHDCLKSGEKRWSWEALSEACWEALCREVSNDIDKPGRRTIMEDIRKMRSGTLGYRAPIKYDRRKEQKGFYYDDPNFTMDRSELTLSDKKVIREAVSILRQFKGFSALEDLDVMLKKMENTWPIRENQQVVVEFDPPWTNMGQEYIDELVKCILEKQAITLHYQPFDKEEPVIGTFSPHLLKEYNNRWFAVGWSHDKKRIEVRALDRIEQIGSASARFVSIPHFHPDEHFANLIGVTAKEGKKVETVRIKARPLQSQYIRSKKMHHNQKEKRLADGSYIFSYRLRPNFELESMLLSYGEFIEILEPESLKKKISSRLRNALKNYQT